MRARTLFAAIAVTVAAGVLMPVIASAHALPQSAVPAMGSSVQQAPSSVLIVFGEPPDPSISTISVVNSAGANVDAGATVVVPGKPDALQVALKPNLPNGVYTVTWKTVSSVDGHLATGSYAFGVGVSATAVPGASSSGGAAPPSALAVIARLLLFAGLVVVLGAVVLSAYAFGAPPLPLRRTMLIAAVVAAVGTAGVVYAQASGAAIGFGELVGSSLGRQLLARAIPMLVVLGSAALLVLDRPHATLLAVVAGAAALVAMGVDVLNSHAAAEGPPPLNEFAQWLHIAAVGVWIGGLVALLVTLRRTRDDDERTHVTHRLSTLAGIGLLVVAVTGVFRAVIEVQTWGNLVSTAFGVLVLLKIGLIVILAALGALNRYSHIPRLPHAVRRLRLAVSSEALVALGAITVAAALVNVAPPAEYAAASSSQTTAPAQLVATGSDYATTVRVRLTVAPGTAGFNTFNLRVADYDTGAPVTPQSVVLQFTQPFRPAVGASSLSLRRQPDGSFAARGGNMSLAGVYEVGVIIENGDASTEVHLQLTTITTPPIVQAQHFPGGLTEYTIRISSNVQATVYLDPNKPGANEFHVTFVNATGSDEVAVSSVIIGMTPPNGQPNLLVSRRLDPTGHFVADADVPSAPTRFDILATTKAGQSIATYITITPGS